MINIKEGAELILEKQKQKISWRFALQRPELPSLLQSFDWEWMWIVPVPTKEKSHMSVGVPVFM